MNSPPFDVISDSTLNLYALRPFAYSVALVLGLISHVDSICPIVTRYVKRLRQIPRVSSVLAGVHQWRVCSPVLEGGKQFVGGCHYYQQQQLQQQQRRHFRHHRRHHHRNHLQCTITHTSTTAYFAQHPPASHLVFALQVATIILQRNGPNQLFELCASFCLAITTFYVRVGLKSKVLLPVSQPLHTSQFCSAILLFRKATLFMSLLKREAKASPAHDGSNRARLANFIKTSGRKLENALGAVKWYDEILALLKLLNDLPDGALATSGFCLACGDARSEF